MHDSAADSKGEYRQLRAITVLSFFLGFSLLVPYGVGSGRAVPAIGTIPLFLSACSGALILTGRLQLAGKKAAIDISLSIFYLIILIPSWFELEDRGNKKWVYGGEIMTGTYGTSLMMLCLTIHFYLAFQAVRTGGLEIPTIVWQSSGCPDCPHQELHHRSVSVAGNRVGLPGSATVYPHEHGFKDFHQPFIQSRDEEDSRDSSEYQTSGFNSPRQSAETLATEFHDDIV